MAFDHFCRCEAVMMAAPKGHTSRDVARWPYFSRGGNFGDVVAVMLECWLQDPVRHSCTWSRSQRVHSMMLVRLPSTERRCSVAAATLVLVVCLYLYGCAASTTPSSSSSQRTPQP